jgi:hypothetical protein
VTLNQSGTFYQCHKTTQSDRLETENRQKSTRTTSTRAHSAVFPASYLFTLPLPLLLREHCISTSLPPGRIHFPEKFQNSSEKKKTLKPRQLDFAALSLVLIPLLTEIEVRGGNWRSTNSTQPIYFPLSPIREYHKEYQRVSINYGARLAKFQTENVGVILERSGSRARRNQDVRQREIESRVVERLIVERELWR